MLDEIKILLGITDNAQDALLDILIKQCVYDAQTITGESDYFKMRPVIVRMVIENYNKIGTEGVDSVSTSGITEKYTEGYSANILALLSKYKKIKFY